MHIAETILVDQDLIISCEDIGQLEILSRQLGHVADQNRTHLHLYQVPADDTWARDHGPITVIRDGRPVLLDFRFNAWGDKYAASKDDAINQQLNAAGAFGNAHLEQINFILEGGSIESDGQGTLLTTSRCLLNPQRNPDKTQNDIEAELTLRLGTDRILWLNHGYLAGDDTDAHIDTLARFCDDNTICYVQCQDPQDEHFETLSKMERELKAFRNRSGKPYRLVPLPMVTAINENGKRLPATYANFLITNNSVLMPAYDTPEDDTALATLQACFPNRQIIAINCRPLIRQHGSLHCITMQIPDAIVLPLNTDQTTDALGGP